MDTLQPFSDALADLVAQAGRGVLRVDARRRLAASGIAWGPSVVVTAHHVIQDDEGIRVGLPDGSEVPAQLAGRDPGTDLAVLKVDAAPAALEASQGQRVGNLVVALGRPGRSVQATLGILSASGESWRTPAGGRLDAYLQTDLVMYPGFSGGPLVDAEGRLVGLNTSAILRGISIVVPTATIDRVVRAILAHGRVRRGYLGVGVQRAALPEDVAADLGSASGLLIVNVEPEGPARAAGLHMGDTLIALDGQPITSLDDLLSALIEDRVGARVPVEILRGGRRESVTVTIGERP